MSAPHGQWCDVAAAGHDSRVIPVWSMPCWSRVARWRASRTDSRARYYCGARAGPESFFLASPRTSVLGYCRSPLPGLVFSWGVLLSHPLEGGPLSHRCTDLGISRRATRASQNPRTGVSALYGSRSFGLQEFADYLFYVAMLAVDGVV